MAMKHKIKIEPSGKCLVVEEGSSLQDVLFEHGAEFPCGGRGTCRRCRIHVLKGKLPVTELEEDLLPEDLASGVRLACAHRVHGDLTLEVEQWESQILADEHTFAFKPQTGLGIAFDLGTTTLAGQLLDLETGNTLAVETALNPQAAFGADIMSRISYAVENGQDDLQTRIREKLGEMAASLVSKVDPTDELPYVTIVGNTPMHNLFCGVNVEPLSRYPFHPEAAGFVEVSAQDLGWKLPSNPRVQFLPSLGSFVGSDVLAGIIASGMEESDKLHILIDLGTNGEIVIGNKDRMICASTAAGPAFEAATISQGMQATAGAINAIDLIDGELRCSVIGSKQPRGICGSGLVDAVAVLLERGDLLASGRFADGSHEFQLTEGVKLTQKDVRELQLAKGAIAVGIRVLLDQWGATTDDVGEVLIAGAFGNYIRLESAQAIGLVKFPSNKIRPIGNSALLGAKMALFSAHDPDAFQPILDRTEHVVLSSHPKFQDFYIDEMVFA